MIKIRKNELLKGFLIYEVIFVVFPVTAIWVAILIMILGSKISGHISDEIYFLFFICVFQLFLILTSIYFILPAQIVSGLFESTLFGFYPSGVAAWFISVAIYSLIALLFAIIVSLYKSTSEYTSEHKGGCISQKDFYTDSFIEKSK
jgi:hypothetical protein